MQLYIRRKSLFLRRNSHGGRSSVSSINLYVLGFVIMFRFKHQRIQKYVAVHVKPINKTSEHMTPNTTYKILQLQSESPSSK